MMELFMVACTGFEVVLGSMGTANTWEAVREIDWVEYYKMGSSINPLSNAMLPSQGSQIDWVEYYKMGSSINPQGNATSRIQYAPIFVSPSMQWAVPNGCLSGPPVGPGGMVSPQ